MVKSRYFSFIDQPSTFDFLGITFKVDENAERERLYQEALKKYPFDIKTGDCTSLQVLIDNIDLEINNQNEKIARGDTNRVGKRFVDGYSKRKTELEQYKNEMQCDLLAQQKEKQEFFDTQNEQLQKAKDISGGTDSVSNIILISIIVIVITVSGIIIVKRLKQ